MKKQNRNLPKVIFQTSSLLLVVGVVAIFGLQHLKPSHAATSTATLSTLPSSGTYQVGSRIAVAIYENSGTEPVGTVQADLTYNSTMLAYAPSGNGNQPDPTGSQYTDIAPPPTLGTGTISVSRGSTTPLTGNQKVTTVDFTVLKAGSASVAFAASSAVYRDSDLTNIYNGGTGSTFTLQAPVVTTPPPTTPTPPVTTPTTLVTTTTPPKTTTPAKQVVTTSYTPTGSKAPVTTASTSTPLVTNQNFTAAPVNTQATSSDGTVINVTQVQYLLNNKFVATVSKAPFSYTVQTKQLRNGTYTLSTKTTYSDGHVVTVNQKLKVNNPYGLTQLSLDAKHYAWATVPFTVLAFVAIGLAVYVLLRPRNGRIHSYGQTDSDLAVTVPTHVITQETSSLSQQDGETVIKPTEPQNPENLK